MFGTYVRHMYVVYVVNNYVRTHIVKVVFIYEELYMIGT